MHRKPILIVGELRENHIALKRVLSNLKQKAIHAVSANDALLQLLLHEFSVILLDIQLPGLRGFITTDVIRSREKNFRTPIIYMTTQTKATLALELKAALKKHENSEQRIQKHQYELCLAELNKIGTINALISELTHELNQPLAGISSYLFSCFQRLSNNNFKVDELLLALEKAQQMTIHSAEITERLIKSARKNPVKPQPVAINQLFRHLRPLLDDFAQEHKITICCRLCKKASTVLLDEVQIAHVILNLVRNSIEALRVHVSKNPIIKIETRVTKKNLIICVKDNGPGIDPARLNQIFKLHFTPRKNMGMGLSICRSIIEAHNGFITAKNQKGGGVHFSIILPVPSIQLQKSLLI